MKRILKVSHTATVARKDPREEVYKFLLAYRATPHSTTGVSPAELLFNRKINTTIPTFQKPLTTNVHKVARSNDNDAKTKMKEYHDTHRHAKASEIGLGDTVLVKQRKSTTKPFYNPTPLIVSAKKGSMITATNKKFTITRDAAKFKRLIHRPEYLQPQAQRKPLRVDDSDDEWYMNFARPSTVHLAEQNDLPERAVLLAEVEVEETESSSNMSSDIDTYDTSYGSTEAYQESESDRYVEDTDESTEAYQESESDVHEDDNRRSKRGRRKPVYLKDYIMDK